MILAILFVLFVFVAFVGVCIFAVVADDAAAEQLERDRIARHVALLQSTEARHLHLRRHARMVP